MAHQAELVLYKNTQYPITCAQSGSWARVGVAFSAATSKFYGAMNDPIAWARWVLAWNPQAANGQSSGVGLFIADDGPCNLQLISEARSGAYGTPRVDAVIITDQINDLIARQIAKTLLMESFGYGGPLIYSSVIELAWR